MENILTQLQGFLDQPFLKTDSTALVALILAFVLGAVYCFSGYQAMRVLSTAIGFGLGLLIGCVIVSLAQLQNPVDLIVILAAAVLVALAGFLLFRAGVFAVVLIGAFAAVYQPLDAYLTLKPMYTEIIAAIVALAFAILAAVYLRPAIIVVTSLAGALILSDRLFDYVIQIRWSSMADMITRLSVSLALALIGILFQFRSTSDE